MTETRTQVHHPLFARVFDRISRKGEEAGQAEHRQRLLDGLSGDVIEVGAGNGMNFRHYPSTVKRVLAVEPESYLRERAQQSAEKATVAIEVVDGVADQLPAEDGAFDAAVASLVLCSVPDQAAALDELRRVLRPGGELRFYEHVVADRPGLARVQRALDATVWPRVAGGCHAARDTAMAIRAAGFEIQRCESFAFVPCPALPTAPHILGVARRP
jgi:ubiquinone/menaquinone biosynthesis C-methylase UbiE